jgi:hypothetical protein
VRLASGIRRAASGLRPSAVGRRPRAAACGLAGYTARGPEALPLPPHPPFFLFGEQARGGPPCSPPCCSKVPKHHARQAQPGLLPELPCRQAQGSPRRAHPLASSQSCLTNRPCCYAPRTWRPAWHRRPLLAAGLQRMDNARGGFTALNGLALRHVFVQLGTGLPPLSGFGFAHSPPPNPVLAGFG